MKKVLAVLLAMMLLLSLAACGGKSEEKETKKEEKQEQPTTPAGEEIEPGAEGTKLETPLWDLTYDEAVWVCDKENMYNDEDWSMAYLYIYEDDSQETYTVCAQISASLESAGDFREMLTEYGFEAEKYADGEYETVTIGGVDCLKHEGESWGEAYQTYFNRVEGAGATIAVEISGDVENADVEKLLNGLRFKLEDVGNEDVPWPWEGEPFEANDASASVGGFTVNSTWIPFEEAMITTDTFNHSVAVIEDTAYIVSSGVVNAYTFGDTLKFENGLDITGEYSYAYADQSGVLWLSAFMESFVGYMGEQEIANYGELDYVAVAPGGDWGVSWFSGPECKLVQIGTDEVTTQDVTFEEVELISHLNVDDEYIYVCGSGDDDEHKVYVYDTNGELQMTFADENGEGLGSITFVAQFDGGFIGYDGNLRQIVLWDESGECLGTADDADLFGTSYPWFCGGTILADGSVMIIMTEDRADESAMELVAFKLTVA